MTLTEAYSFLFMDSFVTALVFPMQSYFAFVVMNIFGTYNILLVGLLAAIGSAAALPVNWVLGRMALAAFSKSPAEGWQLKLSAYMRKHSYWLVLFAWIPIIGPMLTLFCGFFRTDLRKIGVLGVLVFAAYFFAVTQIA